MAAMRTADEPCWKETLQSGSLMALQDRLATCTTDDVPKNLLHLSCHERGVDLEIIPYLIEKFPEQLLQTDQAGHIPLHYVCQWRSFAALPVLHSLLTASPETILTRLVQEEDEDEDEDGILPSLLAHLYGAPPTVVQYLLRRQLQAQKGLVLTHNDMIQLSWGEDGFLEHVAVALQQVAQQQPEVLQTIRLVECRLPYASWKLLQAAMEHIPAGQLQRLQLIHLHIWHESAGSRHHPHPLQQQRQLVAADMEFWQGMVQRHKSTLQALELPQFYALSAQTVHQIAHTLAQQEFPKLQVLDARAPKDNNNTTRRNKNPTEGPAAFTKALQAPSCRLKSLALSHVTPTALLALLQVIATNRSLQFFHLESIRHSNNHPIPWNSLRQALVTTLQRNTSLDRVLGPRPLLHNSPQVQLYLKLNREYHRRDIGQWSPTLVAHVLAKQVVADNRNDRRQEANVPEDPKSAMFYILQSRPDILVSKQYR